MNHLRTHLEQWIAGHSPLITSGAGGEGLILIMLAVLVLTGILFTRLARRIHLPAVTGQILGGIIIGHYILNIFPENAYESFAPVTKFVLGLIGLTIGSHIDFRKLHNAGRRIIWIALFDLVLTIPLVYLGLRYIAGMTFHVSLIAAVIAGATAPGSVIHVINEKRSKGIFTKTVLAVVALNNVIVILLFYTVYYILSEPVPRDVSLVQAILQPLIYLVESLVDGGAIGLALIWFTERKHRMRISFPAMVLLALVLTVGISESLHFSGLLSCMILGMIITNFSKYRDEFFSALSELEEVIYALFFVLAGTHFDFGAMRIAGFAGLVLILIRFAGKYGGPTLGALLARATRTVRQDIGIALFPLAGLAIGLVLFAENALSLREHSGEITAIVLSAVVVFELAGPIFTGLAIRRAGEEMKNRLRLLDFLQEEYIMIGQEPMDKWKTLEVLAEFLHRTHNMKEVSLKELKKTVLNREREISTGIGGNIAIPHAVVDGGPQIQGVIGVWKNGVDFDSFDGEPVHIIIMVATPRDHYELHLQVLATVAKIFGHHSHIKEMITAARTPEEVYEILQREEVDDLNPFFEK